MNPWMKRGQLTSCSPKQALKDKQTQSRLASHFPPIGQRSCLSLYRLPVCFLLFSTSQEDRCTYERNHFTVCGGRACCSVTLHLHLHSNRTSFPHKLLHIYTTTCFFHADLTIIKLFASCCLLPDFSCETSGKTSLLTNWDTKIV